MQINFTPQKIKAAKAYIENLEGFSEERDKKKKISFFKRIQNFLRFQHQTKTLDKIT